MILMAVITVMGKNNFRIELRLNLLKQVFNKRPLVREITLAKRSNLNLPVGNCAKEIVCAPSRFCRSLSRRAKNDPPNLQVRTFFRQLQQDTPCADFDIVGLRSYPQNSTHQLQGKG